jgi:hypothetical protein
MNLCEAIKLIESKFGNKVTAIQYEDGSKRKFNVQLNGGQWKFVIL